MKALLESLQPGDRDWDLAQAVDAAGFKDAKIQNYGGTAERNEVLISLPEEHNEGSLDVGRQKIVAATQSGAFAFANLPPGSINLGVDKATYLNTRFPAPGRTIRQLTPGRYELTPLSGDTRGGMIVWR